MTFGRVLCERCNNNSSQPWDRAYDRLIEWSLEHRSQLLDRRRIDFEDVYGEQWEEEQLQLFRYFAKYLGCCIAAAGHDVPTDLRELLHTSPFRTAFKVSFHVHEDLLLGPGLDQGLLIGALGHLPSEEHHVAAYWCDVTIGWLSICLWYGMESPADATEWMANKKSMKLGSRSYLNEEQREEVRRRGEGLPHRPVFDGE